MVIQQPDRRAEIVGWHAKSFVQELKEDETAMVGLAGMGFAVSNLADIQAKELLAEIEQVFDCDMADNGVCGSFKSVKQDILHPRCPRRPSNLDSFDRIGALNKYIEHNLHDQ